MIEFHRPPATEPEAPSRNAIHESIVRDYDRLGLDDKFRFGCHPCVPCFNDCCSDVNIFLTPYDVLRLKNRLKMTSGDFLSAHTLMPVHDTPQLPMVMLRMREDDDRKRCPFVDAEQGCTVYEDRPWACRMFPVGKASPDNDETEPFYFLMPMEVCRGWEEGSEWTVRQWMEDQRVAEWDEAGDVYKAFTLHPFFTQGGQLTPQQADMIQMVFFDLDRFREFVFGSSLLKRIEVDNALLCRMRKHDDALLEFGYQWLRFAVLREPTIRPVR